MYGILKLKKQSNKEVRRLLAITNGTHKKPYTSEELYDLIAQADDTILVVILYNIIHRMNLEKK